MDIASFLSADAVFRSQATSKRQVLQDIAKQAHLLTDLPERDVLHALVERERLGSTAMGCGIAIPHARFNRLSEMTAIFVRSRAPVEYDAPDDAPVDLFFALLAPKEGNATHLRAMARISRLLRNSHSCGKIRQAVTTEVIYNLLTAEDEDTNH